MDSFKLGRAYSNPLSMYGAINNPNQITGTISSSYSKRIEHQKLPSELCDTVADFNFHDSFGRLWTTAFTFPILGSLIYLSPTLIVPF